MQVESDLLREGGRVEELYNLNSIPRTDPPSLPTDDSLAPSTFPISSSRSRASSFHLRVPSRLASQGDDREGNLSAKQDEESDVIPDAPPTPRTKQFKDSFLKPLTLLPSQKYPVSPSPSSIAAISDCPDEYTEDEEDDASDGRYKGDSEMSGDKGGKEKDIVPNNEC